MYHDVNNNNNNNKEMVVAPVSGADMDDAT
jgi:hypothetical protein